jgi:hypothetical protein
MDNQLSLFECSVVDPARDNREQHLFLALQKQRTRPIEYNLNGVQARAADRRFSIATIWDWDVVIFARRISTRRSRVARPAACRLRPTTASSRSRGTVGVTRELAQAIAGRATMVITNIRQADQPELGMERGFHWLGATRESKSLPHPAGRHYADHAA